MNRPETDSATLYGVKAGDTLILTNINKPSVHRKVTVYKVGRTLVQIPRHEGKPKLGIDTFRIADGRRNDDYGHERLSRPETNQEQQ